MHKLPCYKGKEDSTPIRHSLTTYYVIQGIAETQINRSRGTHMSELGPLNKYTNLWVSFGEGPTTMSPVFQHYGFLVYSSKELTTYK